MQVLPVAHRELSVAARKRWTAGSRFLSAGVALLFVFFLLAFTRNPIHLGPRLLAYLTVILLIEALLSGVRYTSDCVSEERREGTLGLLFLTNLTGFDVVLGKIVARAMPALYNLLAVVPIFALALLFGGVTGAQVFWLGLVLLTAMSLSLSLGVFVSTTSSDERKVLLGTLFVVAVISFGPPILWKIESLTLGSGRIDALLLLSPIHAFNRASAVGGADAAQSCAILGSLSASLLALSAFRVRRAFRIQDAAETVRPALMPRIRPFRTLLQLNPFYWLVMRGQRLNRWWLWGGGLVLFGIFARLSLPNNVNRVIVFVAIFGSYGLHLISKFLLAEESVRRLCNDRRSGALELLLSTPLPSGFILRGQQLAIRKLFAPVFLGLVAMNILWMTEREFLRELPAFLPCSIVLLFSDAQALFWRGVYNALRGERYVLTVMRTYFLVMLPPLAAVVLLFLFLQSTGASNSGVQASIVIWTVCVIAYNQAIKKRSQAALANFRALAAGEKWKPAWVAGQNVPPTVQPQPA